MGKKKAGVCDQIARCTFPDFKHEVHTYARRVRPSCTMRIRCRLAYHFLLVALLEWATVYPVVVPLSHTTQRLAISFPPNRSKSRDLA